MLVHSIIAMLALLHLVVGLKPQACTCTAICTHTLAHTLTTHKCTCACTHSLTHALTRTRTHAHTHARTLTCTHACTHTQLSLVIYSMCPHDRLLSAPTSLWGRCGRHNSPTASSVMDFVNCCSDGSRVPVDTVHSSLLRTTPLFLPGGTISRIFLPTYSWPRLLTCPNHLNRAVLVLSDIPYFHMLPHDDAVDDRLQDRTRIRWAGASIVGRASLER